LNEANFSSLEATLSGSRQKPVLYKSSVIFRRGIKFFHMSKSEIGQGFEGLPVENRANGKSSIVAENLIKNTQRELRALDNPVTLWNALNSFDPHESHLPLSSEDKNMISKAQDVAFQTKKGATSLQEATQAFSGHFNNGLLTDQERARLKTTLAEERATKLSQHELKPIIEAVDKQGDPFSVSPNDGRFLLVHESKSKPINYDLKHLFSIKNLLVDTPINVEDLSLEQRAEFITNYLISLTRNHTPNANMNDQFIKEVNTTIAKQLQNGRPLKFSVFLSMEKFANPFDTKDSNIDFGELQIALEMSAFIKNIEHVTGHRPILTIMNESPINQRFTYASETVYRMGFVKLLRALGVEEQVKFLNFDLDFFSQYLQHKGYSPADASALTKGIFDVMLKTYHAISEQKDKKDTGTNAVDNQIKESGLPEGVAQKLGAFLKENFAVIVRESEQAIQTESNKSIDPRLLFPKMSESLWQYAFDKTKTPEGMKQVRGELRRLLLEQAKLQGFFFKALMRMRYAYKAIFNDPVISSEVIPLSITNAPNKLSISFGRYPKTGIIIDNKEVKGVGPQHGVGVINNGTIVSIPWNIVTKNPDSFHPAVINMGETQIYGYINTKQGAVVDFDGTVKGAENLFPTIHSFISTGKPFGIATGRSQESIRRLILDPFKEFLRSNTLPVVDDRLLFVSGNNGAVSTIGVENPQILHQVPLDMKQVVDLPEQTLLKQLVKAYIGEPLSLERLREMDLYDKYCLYLEGERLPKATAELQIEGIPLTELANMINKELAGNRIPIQAIVNTEGIDVVSTKASKARAMVLYRTYFREVTGKKPHANEILSVGDNPEGNDRKLVNRPSGNSVITKQGPDEVVLFVNTNLNNNV